MSACMVCAPVVVVSGRGFDPVLGIALEAERVHHKAGGVQYVPSLDKTPCVGLNVCLLDSVAHGVPLWLVADASIVTAFDDLPVTFVTLVTHCYNYLSDRFKRPPRPWEALTSLDHWLKLSTPVVVVVHNLRSYIRLITCA